MLLRPQSLSEPLLLVAVAKVGLDEGHSREEFRERSIVCMDEENTLNPSRMGIVLEGNMVMDGLANLPQVFCVLFGLTGCVRNP